MSAASQTIAGPPADTFSTLANLGVRIAALVAEEQGPWPTPDHGYEKMDLTHAGFALPVTTLADAAVLCDLAFAHAMGSWGL